MPKPTPVPVQPDQAPAAAQDQPALHQPTPAHPPDAYTGLGGRYVRDPATGQRRPATTEPTNP